MPRYLVIPTDQTFSSAEIIAPDAAEVLNIVHRLHCGEADVFEDESYTFPVRCSENGLWTIFTRPAPPEPKVEAYG